MKTCHSGRRAAGMLAAGLLAVAFATPASAAPQLNPVQKVGKYRVSMFDAPYETLSDNATYFSSMTPNIYAFFYYYTTQQFTIPADFNWMYFGQAVTRITVSPAWIGIGTSSYQYENTALPTGGVPNGMLAPWWEPMGGSVADDNKTGIRWEITGEGDEQILKIEFKDLYNFMCYEAYDPNYYPACEGAKHFKFAVWIYEAADGRDSLIQYRYAPISNPAGSDSPYPYGWTPSATVGIESPDNATGLMVFSCNNNCKPDVDWPENKVIQFGQGPDLIAKVKGEPKGWAGVPMQALATVTNNGAVDAIGFGAKLYASADTTLDIGDELIGLLPLDVDDPSPDPAGLYTVATEDFVEIDFTAPLPRGLEEGLPYYLIVDADPPSDANPRGLIKEDVESNNWGSYGPFIVSPPTPDLAVSDIQTDTLAVAPGQPITVTWKLTNSGNLFADGVPFWVVLSVEDVITPSDTVIGQGFLQIDELTSMDITPDTVEAKYVTFNVPATTRPGIYHLGVVIDPDNQLAEIDDFNNVGILGDLVLIGSDSVSIASDTLPTAYVAAPYCERLQAAGGNGTYVWSAKDPATLPPGLTLREEPADARAKGKPFDTLLCGVPSLKGSWQFDVSVTSSGKTVTKKLKLSVEGEVPPLAIVTQELPSATFQVGYEASLFATGGAPPYTWSLQEDTTPLPRGVTLRGDGRLTGMPQLDGRFPFKVQVTDTAGTVARGEMYVSVTPPGRLTCVSQALEGARVGEEYTSQLYAAGGNKPYIWSTVESRRLAEGVSDPGETVPNEPPPGLVLAESGSVSGTPSNAGSYLWTARVTDQREQEDVCILSLEFSSGALNVTTAGLPLVCTDEEYSVQLEAGGGDGGFLTWTLDENSSLPEGIELTSEGLLTGNVSPEVLEGNPAKTFNVTVHVRDSSNAKGVGAVALRVTQCKTSPPPPPRIVEQTGCSTSSSAPGLIGLAALALLAFRRRR